MGSKWFWRKSKNHELDISGSLGKLWPFSRSLIPIKVCRIPSFKCRGKSFYRQLQAWAVKYLSASLQDVLSLSGAQRFKFWRHDWLVVRTPKVGVGGSPMPVISEKNDWVGWPGGACHALSVTMVTCLRPVTKTFLRQCYAMVGKGNESCMTENLDKGWKELEIWRRIEWGYISKS